MQKNCQSAGKLRIENTGRIFGGTMANDFVFGGFGCFEEKGTGFFGEFLALLSSAADNRERISAFLDKNGFSGADVSGAIKRFFLYAKETHKADFDKNPSVVFLLYKCIQFLTFDDFKSIFPAKKSVVEQNIYDYSTEIFKSKDADAAVENFARGFISSAFSVRNIEKNKDEKYDDDLSLLQKLFAFLLFDSAEKLGLGRTGDFCTAGAEYWSAENLSAVMNALAQKLDFNGKTPIELPDFRNFSGKHFGRNESVLRLLYNFTRPEQALKEGIINELNFVREQQRAILPIWPNTRKDNFTPSDASSEIRRVKENLKTLKSIDFGFSDSAFSQTFFINDEEKAKSVTRTIKCRCFSESEMEWESIERKKGRIFARRKERTMIKKSLDSKFLYPERNKITHVGENFAVFTLFTKDYKERDKYMWEELFLQAFFDARKYLEKGPDKEISKQLIAILDYFFEKTTRPLGLPHRTPAELYKRVFNNGEIAIPYSEIKKTNVFSNLTDTEIRYLKHFLGFLYCSENIAEDFILRNKAKIQVYLIYLTLELTKLESAKKK